MFEFTNSKGLVLGMVLLVATGLAFAQGHAHEHGVAEIGIAVDGKTAQIEFTAPGSAIMGFEHEATTEADKKKMADAFAKFRNNTSKMFVFEPKAQCTATTKTIGVAEEHHHDHDHDHNHAKEEKAHDHDHGHLDVRALVDVKCQQALEGTTLSFQVRQFFPEAETLRVQVVGNNFQTGAELKGNRNQIKLSR